MCEKSENTKKNSPFDFNSFTDIEDSSCYDIFSNNNNYSLSIKYNDNKEDNISYFGRDYKKRKYETIRDNLDIVGKKLFMLVNDFHNKTKKETNKAFSINFHSRKLIDRIRTIKKLKII